MKHTDRISQSVFDLIETFPQPGCAMCTLLLQVADRQCRTLLGERWVDEPTHNAIRQRRGLCSAHTRQITEYRGNALTVVIFYRTAVDEVVKLLDGIDGDAPPARARLGGLRKGRGEGELLAAKLAPRARCAICDEIDRAERRYIEAMATRLGDPRLRAAYEGSQGLCLPHFEMSLSASSDAGIISTLIGTQRRIWSELRDDLDAFIAKADYRHGYADKGREGDSGVRATQMPGADRLFGVDPRGR